jgi:hypothetical protein
MSAAFSDSIDANLELLRQLLAGQTRDQRQRSVAAATAIEGLVVKIQKDSPKDPAVALGVIFGLLMISQRIVGASESGGQGDENLIQLLS